MTEVPADPAPAVGLAVGDARARARGATVVHGALAGAAAAAVAAIVDGAQAWGHLAQFAPSLATRLGTLAYLASTHALVGLVAGAAITALALVVGRALAPGPRRPHPARAATLILTIVPLCAWLARLTEHGLARALAHRKHPGLIVLSAEAVTVAAMVGAVTAGVLLTAGLWWGVARLRKAPTPPPAPTAAHARPRTLLIIGAIGFAGIAVAVASYLVRDALAPTHLPRQIVAATMSTTIVALAIAAALAVLVARLGAPLFPPDRRVGRALAHRAAPGWAGWSTAVVVAGALIFHGRATLALLPARPVYVAALALALAGPAWLVLAPLLHRLGGWRPWRRRTLVGALPVLLLVLAALTGTAAAVKAAVAYSGGGDAITRGLTRIFDLDRDGYSPWFGGDDCDDLDASIHPGALDLPDDGIDQNCVAGDARLARTALDVGMIPLPPSVPADTNIVLITIDTLRADHLGAYGYGRPTSPNLDALAADGARFAAGWAHAPSTRYSMPAILTGRLPLQVDYDTSIAGWPGLLPRATTIAELLAGRGFTTAAFTNYWYFDPVRRMNQGFAIYDNDNARLHQGADPAHTRGSSSREQTDKALGFLAEHAADRFFLWVHYYDPHHDYEPHPEVPSFGTDDVARYDGEIRYSDLHVGRLFDDLKAKGLWDKTVIVVTGDHGEGFGEHAIKFHGYDLYAAQTKVPLIVRVPGLAPRVVTTAAGHVDILPTLANLAGAPASPAMMGSSLLGWIAGTRAEDDQRTVFQQVQYEGNHDKRGAASAHCHVLYEITPHTSWQVYDVERDPGETHDRSAAPGRCAATRRSFARWFDSAQIPAGAAEALLPGPPDVAHPLDIDLGPEIRLLAVDLPARVTAGAAFDITWTFAARGRLADGWKVFVHFEAPTGGRFTADHPPARPFAWWRPGQYVRYTITATVPAGSPPGRYDLWTGLWRKQDRRPVTAPPGFMVKDNRVKVTTLEVVRP